MMSGHEGFFTGGGGVHILRHPRGKNFLRRPLYSPPSLEGYFQVWGGGGV